MSLERLAFNRIKQRYSLLQRTGFRRAVKNFMIIQGCPPDEVDNIRFIPDGWFKYKGGKFFDTIFVAVEIEDFNPLTREKLWLYCDLWDSLEYHFGYLRLFTYDRYGSRKTEHDLFNLYFEYLRAGW